jgi:hypothetical protein
MRSSELRKSKSSNKNFGNKTKKLRKIRYRTGMRDENGLLPRQRLFIKYYVANNYVGSIAAEQAGYAKSHARNHAKELLKNPIIQELIEKEIEKRNKKVELTEEKVLRDLIKTTKAAFFNEKYGHALKGIELAGKHLGMWVDRSKHEIEDNAIVSFERAQQECMEILQRMVPDYSEETDTSS